jgi:hypothetical protein
MKEAPSPLKISKGHIPSGIKLTAQQLQKIQLLGLPSETA